ncbi:MAG: DUF1553 domain-containing protein, partial [Planctomycetia bacterium]|nr:DUF1553 domain-containing protein [Planctomycetia bacterium]
IRVDADGLIHPLADGMTTLSIVAGQNELKIPVTVSGIANPPPVSFEHEIIPILTKARCNSGGCHGKAEGQNGFKLSLLGFDGTFDYDALIREGKGRRVVVSSPPQSLVLRKAIAEVPHGGGRKINPGSPQHLRLLRWIAEGAPHSVPGEQPVGSIVVEPAAIRLRPHEQQQIRVTALEASGARRDATVEAEFISNAGHIVEANPRGLLQAADGPGEAAILVRYLGHVAVCRVVVPREGQSFPRPPENNFIDKLVWDKLVELGIEPGTPVDDAGFLRRTHLDVIGTLPTAAEARRFLNDPAPDKRARLVDELLGRPEYADYWAMKWADVLRADKIKVTHQGTVGLTRWLRRQFSENRPYDELVRDILTAQGPVQSESPVPFFKALDQPETASRAISQLFLGVRIECAQCHHHPSERWGQDDYAGLAGFFTGVRVKKLPGGTEAIVSRQGTDAKHPRTGDPVAARALGAKDADFAASSDRRAVLADWMTRGENPYFARAIANRLWAHYFGRGLVEPIDDLRATNPPTNEPLMEALAAHLRDVKYDLKAFTRTLLASRAYQLGPMTNPSNAADRQHFSHALPKALPAEVLLDAVCQATGVPEKFNGWPAGTRSIAIWDNRMPSYFFRIFGRPVRATVCECERSNEPSISQALHLLNSREINEKIASRDGTARRLADTSLSTDDLIDEIYLGTLSRFPAAEERALTKDAFSSPGATRRQAIEDILWSVLNTKEFLYNH